MGSSAHTPASARAGVSGGARQFVKKLLWVGAAAVRQFFADQCPQQAAAISYRVLFSTAPLAIVFVSIFGLVLQDDSVRRDVVRAIVDALPVSAAGRQDVEDALTAIATPASAAGLVSLLLFGWASTGMTGAIRRGLECAMGVTESRPLARGKLVDLALVLGAAVLTLLTIALTLLGNVVQRDSGAVSGALGLGSAMVGEVLLRVALFSLSVVVVLLLYRFVPARGLRIRDGLVGAIVTAVLLQLISLASAWIYAKTTRLTVVYGSLTTALVFLYSSTCARRRCSSAPRSRPPGHGPPRRVVSRSSRNFDAPSWGYSSGRSRRRRRWPCRTCCPTTPRRIPDASRDAVSFRASSRGDDASASASLEARRMVSVAPLAFGARATGLTVTGVVALILAAAALISLFRNADLSGGAKTMWILIILFVPIFGSLIYFGVRSDW